MPTPDDLWIGQIAIERGLITEAQLKEFLNELGHGEPAYPSLGALLLARGVVNDALLGEVLREHEGRKATSAVLQSAAAGLEAEGAIAAEHLLGQWLVRHGHTSEDRVQECLAVQKEAVLAGRPASRLGELLVGKGYVTREVVLQGLAQQKKTLLRCEDCKKQFNVVGHDPSAAYPCRSCGGLLKKSDGTQRISADATDRVPIVRRRPSTRSQPQLRPPRSARAGRGGRASAAPAALDPRLLYGGIGAGVFLLLGLFWAMSGSRPAPAPEVPSASASAAPAPPRPPSPAPRAAPSESFFYSAEHRLQGNDAKGAAEEFRAFLKLAPHHTLAVAAESRLYGLLKADRVNVKPLPAAQ